jgi:hypothetical protein
VDDWLQTVRTFRFWLDSVLVLLCTWGAAAAFMAVMRVQQNARPEEAQGWTYILVSAIMPTAASLLGVHWGLTGVRPGTLGQAASRSGQGPPADFLATVARGLVFAALALALLLVQAGIAGASGAVAGAAARVSVLEFAVFGAIGAGMSALIGRPVAAGVTGWALAAALAVGNVGAVWALLPAVLADEPVSVAMNIEWGPDSIPVRYECAPEIAGTAEVFHTERIMWLAAPNPMVLFTLLAGDEDRPGGVLASLSAALQEASDGTRIPCLVNSQPEAAGPVQAPLALAGVAIQGGLAGALLAAGHHATRRRGSLSR